MEELKEAIKNKNPRKFENVDADELTLHQIKIVLPDDIGKCKAIMDEVTQPGYVFDPKTELYPMFKISEYFKQDLERGIHILVELPQSKSIDP